MTQFRSEVLQWAGRIAKYSTLKRLAEKFGFGYMSQPPTDPTQGEPAEPRPQPVRFLQWYGFRSRPQVQGAECLVVAARAGSANAVAVACDNLAVGPLDLAEGESVMYGSGGSTIRHDQAGVVTVNGGTLRVARETDPCRILGQMEVGAFLAVWMSQVEGALNALAVGTVAPLSSTFLSSPGIVIKDGAGAPKFKA